MSEHLRSYDVARKTFSFLEFIGWSVVVIGIITGFALVESADRYATESQKFLLFLVGAGASMVGLFMVGSVQNWRAGVDSAEYGQQTLKVAREQLAISKQSMRLQDVNQNSFTSLGSGDDPTSKHSFDHIEPSLSQPPARSIDVEPSEYRGERIRFFYGAYRSLGKSFENYEDAQKAIDEKLDGPSMLPEVEEVNEAPVPQTFSDTRAFIKAEQQASSTEIEVLAAPAEDKRDEDLFGLDSDDGMKNEETEADVLENNSPQEIPEEATITSAQPRMKIEEEGGKFTYGRLEFSSREAAEKYVKQLGVNPNYKG